MRKLIYAILLISSCVYSQTEKRSAYDVKSPNVSDFIRYGNIPVKMYTGELDFNVPLINYKDINLSLSYNSSGFIPSKRSGIVGLNWNINGIGMITREVKGIPDDHIGAPTTTPNLNGRTAHGFMVGMQYLKNAGGALPNGTVTNNPIVFDGEIRHRDAAGGTTNSFETTPDIFNFNVNGLSGKFFMTSDGKIKVISNSPNIVTVDITNFNFQPNPVSCSPIKFSEFKIIDQEGNKYYFGGESKYLEYTLDYNKPSQSQDGTASNPIINTWFLKRIEYYTRDITNYNYQDDLVEGPSYFCDDPINWFKSARISPTYKRLFFMTENVFDSGFTVTVNGQTTNSGGFSDSYTLHKKAFLESITGNFFSVTFEYAPQNFSFNNNPNLNAYFKRFDEFKLNKIKLQYVNELIKTIDFTYSIRGGTASDGSYPRLFLDKVQEAGKPPHQFEYDILPSQNLPVPSTCAVDFWGFYNGKLTNDAPPFGFRHLIPGSIIDANSDQTFTSDIRNSNFNFAKIGMLKKVVYPTGGYTEFEYEPHTYSKRLERKSVNNFLSALIDASGQVGGVRIKKISDFDGTQITNVKEYLYTNANNTSSGILMQWPRTKFDYNYQANAPGCWHEGIFQAGYSINSDISIFQSSSINMNSIENSVMSYSRVIEKTSSNGYRVYNFKDYINYPDNNSLSLMKLDQVGNICGDILQETFSPENLVKNANALYNDKSIERGKVENVLVYDNNNNLLVKEEYLYNTNPNRFDLNSQFGSMSNYWWYKSNQYYYSDFLTEKKVTKYKGLSSLVTTDKTTYISAPNYSTLMSNQDILSKHNTTSSVNNEVVETEYKYPWQNYLTTSTEFLNFKNANIMYPIRETQYRNAQKLSEKFTLFAKDATTHLLMLPKSIYSAKFPNSFANITDIGNLEKRFTYDLYDNRGNISQCTPEGGVPTSIIWGYNLNETLPIAKIENASYTEVQPYAHNLETISMTGTEANLIIALNNLRTMLPNAMVTTYTHIPLVGVSTITDPKGNVITYSYDSLGRLLNVKDKNNNVINANTYNYKH